MPPELHWEKVQGSPYDDERAHLGEDPKKPIDAKGNIGQIYGYVGRNGEKPPEHSLHWTLRTVFPDRAPETPKFIGVTSGNMKGTVDEVRARVFRAYEEMGGKLNLLID